MAQAAESKRARAFEPEVVREHVPAVVETGEVVRPDAARDAAAIATVAVAEFEDFAFGQGFGDGFEGAPVGFFRGEGPEGQGVAEVADGMEFAVIELAGEFVEGGPEGFLEGGAAILGEGFVSDQDGEEVGFGEGRFGEALDGFGIVEAVTARVVFDGQAALVFHEGEVAGDGADGDAEAGGHGAAVGIGAGAEPVVDHGEAFPGGTLAEARAATTSWGKGIFDFGLPKPATILVPVDPDKLNRDVASSGD